MLPCMKRRRVRHRREEIERLVGQYCESGMSQRRFAVRKGISLSTLSRWIGMEKRRSGNGPGRGIKGKKQASLVEVALGGQIAYQPGGIDYEVELLGGERLLVRPGFAIDELEAILGVLRKAER
jgi:hypothetical protein